MILRHVIRKNLHQRKRRPDPLAVWAPAAEPRASATAANDNHRSPLPNLSDLHYMVPDSELRGAPVQLHLIRQLLWHRHTVDNPYAFLLSPWSIIRRPDEPKILVLAGRSDNQLDVVLRLKTDYFLVNSIEASLAPVHN